MRRLSWNTIEYSNSKIEQYTTFILFQFFSYDIPVKSKDGPYCFDIVMGWPTVATTMIPVMSERKLLPIGQPPEYWSQFRNDLTHEQAKKDRRLWQWFMDFSPYKKGSNEKYFMVRGGGKKCNIKATIVSKNRFPYILYKIPPVIITHLLNERCRKIIMPLYYAPSKKVRLFRFFK